MKYLRILLALTGLWIFLADDIARLLGVTSITPYAYMIMIACALLPILFPPAKRSFPLVTFLTAILLLILLKTLGGSSIDAASLPRMAIEIGAIGLTIILASLLGAELKATEQMFEDIGLSKVQKNVDSFVAGQRSIYREIHWARRYQRHATILAISINDHSLERLLEGSQRRELAHRLMIAVRGDVWRGYALSQLAKLLIDELGDNAIITQRGDRFIILLVEVDRAQSYTIMEELKTTSKERLELDLDIGAAVFPDEAVTLEALLQRAEAAMLGMIDDTSPKAMFNAKTPRTDSVSVNTSDIRANDGAASAV